MTMRYVVNNGVIGTTNSRRLPYFLIGKYTKAHIVFWYLKSSLYLSISKQALLCILLKVKFLSVLQA